MSGDVVCVAGGMMRFERRILWVAAFVCAIPLLLWLGVFWTPEFADDLKDWSSFGDYFGGVISPLLSFLSFVGLLLTIRFQRVVGNDQRYSDHAISCMSRAYEALDQNGAPKRDRLAWLTCARLLLSAQEAASRISEHSDGIRNLLAGEEEHWRHKFYELIKPVSADSVGASATFFALAQIEERSIRVVFEFAGWPEDKPDPIDSVPSFSAEELQKFGVGMSGVRDYVLTMPRFRKRDG